MTDFTSEKLKLQAENHLTKILGKSNYLFQGSTRELIILSMCSFVIEVCMKEINEILIQDQKIP